MRGCSLNNLDYGLIDHYGSVKDLHSRSIRVLHDQSFQDDPTRILRAIRFEQRFGFKIERKTMELIKSAVKGNAFKTVHPHRLRDEIVLLLKESDPIRCLARVEELVGFGHIIGVDKFKIDHDTFDLLARTHAVIYGEGFKLNRYRMLDKWLIYLMAVFAKLDIKYVKKFVESFDLKKESGCVSSAKAMASSLKKIAVDVSLM